MRLGGVPLEQDRQARETERLDLLPPPVPCRLPLELDREVLVEHRGVAGEARRRLPC